MQMSTAKTSLQWVMRIGRASYPDVHLEMARLVAHVTFAEVGDEALRARPADLYLAAACAAGSEQAVEVVERTCLGQIRGHLRRLRLGADIADEACQALRCRMLVGESPQASRYNGAIPFGHWLRLAAVRIALDLVRSSARHHALEEIHAPSFARPV